MIALDERRAGNPDEEDHEQQQQRQVYDEFAKYLSKSCKQDINHSI